MAIICAVTCLTLLLLLLPTYAVAVAILLLLMRSNLPLLSSLSRTLAFHCCSLCVCSIPVATSLFFVFNASLPALHPGVGVELAEDPS